MCEARARRSRRSPSFAANRAVRGARDEAEKQESEERGRDEKESFPAVREREAFGRGDADEPARKERRKRGLPTGAPRRSETRRREHRAGFVTQFGGQRAVSTSQGNSRGEAGDLQVGEPGHFLEFEASDLAGRCANPCEQFRPVARRPRAISAGRRLRSGPGGCGRVRGNPRDSASKQRFVAVEEAAFLLRGTRPARPDTTLALAPEKRRADETVAAGQFAKYGQARFVVRGRHDAVKSLVEQIAN